MGGGDLTGEEERNFGSVPTRIYQVYLVTFGGVCYVIILLISYAIGQVAQNGCDVWLAAWTSKAIPNSTIVQASSSSSSPTSPPTQAQVTAYYLGVYVGIFSFMALVQALKNVMFALGAKRASLVMHRRVLRRILYAPCSFFDSTPTGRIINRFSKDIEELDIELPVMFDVGLSCLVVALGFLITICFTNPWVFCAMPVIIFMFYRIQVYYRKSSIEVQRLESVTRSPVF